MTRLARAEWYCLEADCDAHGTGSQADVDRAAAKHCEKPPKHATATRVVAA
jgi:hypothetical protein